MPALIDSHQHFWSLGANGFEWPTPDLAAIYRDFGPADLHAAADGLELAGSVAVQSQPSLADTEWLLRITADEPLIKAVVGWVDFESSGVLADIDRLAAHPKLRGLRPMLQNLPEDDWVLRAEFDSVFERMVALGLSLDALVFPRHLPFLEARIRKHPELKVVIDHGAKPGIAQGEFSDWAAAITQIAALDQVYCKLSGLPTEMAAGQSEAVLAPYIRHLVTSFGARRLMWGSDWPVVNLSSSYRSWFDSAVSLSGLAGGDLDQLCHGTAMRFYSIA